MKHDPEHDRLLDDVLAELAPPDFRAGLLDRTLKQVRRKHRLRQWNRGVLAAACVAALGLLVLHNHAPVTTTKPEAFPGALTIISSQPLDDSMIVTSLPNSVPMIASAVSTIAMVETDPTTRNFRELTDTELLALVPGQPAVLVRKGPHQEELLLVDSGAGIIIPGDGSGR